jgi:hypothetical protein
MWPYYCTFGLRLISWEGSVVKEIRRRAGKIYESFWVKIRENGSSWVPSTATHLPSTATHVPSTATHVPSTATHVPSTATHVPSTATHVLSTATHVPSTATHVPSTATHVPSTDTHVPSTATRVPLYCYTCSLYCYTCSLYCYTCSLYCYTCSFVCAFHPLLFLYLFLTFFVTLHVSVRHMFPAYMFPPHSVRLPFRLFPPSFLLSTLAALLTWSLHPFTLPFNGLAPCMRPLACTVYLAVSCYSCLFGLSMVL